LAKRCWFSKIFQVQAYPIHGWNTSVFDDLEAPEEDNDETGDPDFLLSEPDSNFGLLKKWKGEDLILVLSENGCVDIVLAYPCPKQGTVVLEVIKQVRKTNYFPVEYHKGVNWSYLT
jgi:hypothetical protein